MRLDARQTLPEPMTAIQTPPLAQLHFKPVVAQSQILGPHAAAHDELAVLARATATWAGFRPGVAGGDPHRSRLSFNPRNPIIG